MKLELQLLPIAESAEEPVATPAASVPPGDASTVKAAIEMMLATLKEGRGAWGAGVRVRVLNENRLSTAEEVLTNAARLLGGAS